MMGIETKGERIRMIPPIAVEDWCWFAEVEDDGNILRIEKAKKVPDEDIQHLLDLAEGLKLLSDELVEDHWFLEQKARFRRWRLRGDGAPRLANTSGDSLTPEAVSRLEAA